MKFFRYPVFEIEATGKHQTRYIAFRHWQSCSRISPWWSSYFL